MHFILQDGKPIWAKYLVAGKRPETEIQTQTVDGIIVPKRVQVLKDVELYAYSDEERDSLISTFETYTVTEVKQPAQEILNRATSMEGKHLSKTEFELELLNPQQTAEDRVMVLEQIVADLIAEKLGVV